MNTNNNFIYYKKLILLINTKKDNIMIEINKNILRELVIGTTFIFTGILMSCGQGDPESNVENSESYQSSNNSQVQSQTPQKNISGNTEEVDAEETHQKLVDEAFKRKIINEETKEAYNIETLNSMDSNTINSLISKNETNKNTPITTNTKTTTNNVKENKINETNSTNTSIKNNQQTNNSITKNQSCKKTPHTVICPKCKQKCAKNVPHKCCQKPNFFQKHFGTVVAHQEDPNNSINSNDINKNKKTNDPNLQNKEIKENIKSKTSDQFEGQSVTQKNENIDNNKEIENKNIIKETSITPKDDLNNININNKSTTTTTPGSPNEISPLLSSVNIENDNISIAQFNETPTGTKGESLIKNFKKVVLKVTSDYEPNEDNQEMAWGNKILTLFKEEEDEEEMDDYKDFDQIQETTNQDEEYFVATAQESETNYYWAFKSDVDGNPIDEFNTFGWIHPDAVEEVRQKNTKK